MPWKEVRRLLARVCAGLKVSGSQVCLPECAYDDGFQAGAAEEVQVLPKDQAVVKMLSDHAAMREQARACGFLRRCAVNVPGTGKQEENNPFFLKD